MLSNLINKKFIFAVLSSGTLSLLVSCSNGTAIENLVGADPQLKNALKSDRSEETRSPVTEIKMDRQTSENEEADLLDAIVEEDNISAIKRNSAIALPAEFPKLVPLYPQAELKKVKSGLTAKKGLTLWESTDDIEGISDYYEREFKDNDWAITKPFALNEEKEQIEAIAVKDNLKVALAISESTENNSKLTISYKPFLPNIAKEKETKSVAESEIVENNSDRNLTAKTGGRSQPKTSKKTEASSKTKFTDDREIPEQLRKYVQDVAALGILSPYIQEDSKDSAKAVEFAPNKPITRGEYARWLIAANNLYHSDSPGKKIHVASNSNLAAFKDISPQSPDFGAIQGLAEAGLIPSMLTDDSSKLLFQPNAPLKREDLIAWKVPLDLRKALPPASTQAIQDSWGFQDVSSIDPATLKALFGDFQNGDNSNINRIFGYTTLFQPKKPVTRAEAAVSLWYFGFQGDGITAPEALAIEN